MAKIDTATIEGYEGMTAEEKLAALEGFDFDLSGYVSKATFDKTASELADKKKQLRERMTEEEKASEAQNALQKSYDELLRKLTISENQAKLIGLGYDESLATSTAIAMADGDTDKVLEAQRQHMEAYAKKLRAEILKQTPRPEAGGNPEGSPMTLEAFRKMGAEERLKFAREHAEEYQELYGGN